MTDEEMIITLHEVATTLEDRDPVYAKEMQQIADRFSELAKAASVAQHKAVQG